MLNPLIKLMSPLIQLADKLDALASSNMQALQEASIALRHMAKQEERAKVAGSIPSVALYPVPFKTRVRTTTIYPPCTLYACQPTRYYESSVSEDCPTMMKYEVSSVSDGKWSGVCWMKTKRNPGWHNPSITQDAPLQELIDELDAGHLICADISK